MGEIERGIKLVERSLLNPLDFAVEMRLAGPDEPPLNPAAGQLVLKFVAGELGAIGGLNALDREGHLFLQVIEELDRILGLARRVDFDYQEACTFIDSRILHADWSDLAGIDLHALTGDLFLVAFDLAPPAFTLQTVDAESAEVLMDGSRREVEPMMALHFALDAPRTEPALSAQFHDPPFLFSENLLTRGMVRSSAAALEAVNAFGLIASPPFTQGGTGDAAASANKTGIAGFFVELDPGAALSGFAVPMTTLSCKQVRSLSPCRELTGL